MWIAAASEAGGKEGKEKPVLSPLTYILGLLSLDLTPALSSQGLESQQ